MKLDDHHIGFEARSVNTDHQAVKIWLRLLSCSTQIEHLIRDQLRRQFGTTLPRFDYLAQLDRHPEGLRMSALSRYLMVTGGNVTGLTDQLVAEGWVQRLTDPNDRRSNIVKLTPAGQAQFRQMAQAHEAWLRALFEGLDAPLKAELYQHLGALRMHLSQLKAPLASERPAAHPPLTAHPSPHHEP